MEEKVLMKTNKTRASAEDFNKLTINSIDDIGVEDIEKLSSHVNDKELLKQLDEELLIETKRILNGNIRNWCILRNKKDENGKLDINVPLEDYTEIKRYTIEQAKNNIRYESKKIYYNRSAGFNESVNDRFLESKRDIELAKTFWCNEYGITPESFDTMITYINQVKQEAIDRDINEFNKIDTSKLIVEAYKQLGVKVEGFEKGKTVVYKSEFIDEFFRVEDEKMAKSDEFMEKNGLIHKTDNSKEMVEVLDHFAKITYTEERQETIKNLNVAQSPEISSKLKDRLNKLKQKKENKPSLSIEEKEETVSRIINKKKKNIFDMVGELEPVIVTEDNKIIETNITNDDIVTETSFKVSNKPVPEEVVEEAIIVNKKEEVQYESTNDIKIDSEEIDKNIKNSEDIIEEDIHNDKLKTVMTEEVKEITTGVNMKKINEILIKYDKEPDISILRNSTISSQAERLKLYKNSASVNGFKLFLPYSGYEIIVKKLLDKGLISYLVTVLASQTKSIDGVLEQEVLRIIYNSIEFPNIERPSIEEFISNLSEGDVPIIMIALAMTNTTADDNGNLTIKVSSLVCTDPRCQNQTPVDNLVIDLKDTFGKIYPIDLYELYHKNTLSDKDIMTLYRNSYAGRAKSISMVDPDGLCKYKIIISKPTIYKRFMVDTNKTELNYEILRRDVLDNDLDVYEHLKEFMYENTYETYSFKRRELGENMMEFNEIIKDKTQSEFEELKNELLGSNVEVILDITDRLNTSFGKLQPWLKLLKFIDAIKIETNDKESIEIAHVNSHDDLAELYNLIMSMPEEIIKECFEIGTKLDEEITYKYEDLIYYDYKVKPLMTKDFKDVFNRPEEVILDEYIKRNEDVNISDEELTHYLNVVNKEKDNINEG